MTADGVNAVSYTHLCGAALKLMKKCAALCRTKIFLKISPDFADKSAAVSYYRHGMKKTRNLPGFGPLKEMNPKW